MKVMIVCSKRFYRIIEDIKTALEKFGHEVVLPNHYDDPGIENRSWKKHNHQLFKQAMFQLSKVKINDVDAVLCLNMSSHTVENYIGGATFIELYEAFMQNKKIYLYNKIPKGMLYDEIHGFNPIVIDGDLEKIREEIYE